MQMGGAWCRYGGRLGFDVVAVICLFFFCSVAGCSRDEPARIGYVGTLTGRHADLGTAGRDGVIFAVEEVNRAGGVEGRQVELVVRDDGGDPETAKRVVQELIDRKVAVIVGPMTSGVALAVAPVVNGSGVAMVSPTVSSNELTGRDDNFFRVYAPSRSTARTLAEHARQRLGMSRVAVIYDLANKAHTEGWSRYFRERFEELGGEVVAVSTYDSSDSVAFFAISRAVAAARPEGVLMLAGGLDTAMFCQQFRKVGAGVRLLASEWSATEELILHGGSAVNGIIFYQNFNRHDTSPRFAAFREAYRQRFSTDPEFGAVYAYDAARVALQGVAAARAGGSIKDAIIRRGRFTGVQGDIRIDRYGDAERTPFLMTVRDGSFMRLE